MAPIEVRYKLEPNHLAEYHIAARERVLGKIWSPHWSWDAARGLVIGVASVALFMAISWAMQTYLGQQLHTPSLVVGLAYGIAFISIQGILSFVVQRKRSPFKAGGPTFALHTAIADGEMLNIKGPNFEQRYRWPVFEELTEHGHVIIAWLEPGAGVVFPRNAFAAPVDETAFVEAVRAKIAAAKSSI
jgi:hypothetical protein